MMRNTFRYAAAAAALAATVGVLSACSSTHASASSSTSSTTTATTATAASDSVTEWLGRGRTNPYAYLPKVPSFKVTSETAGNGKPLPIDQWSGVFGAGGKDMSPQLSWFGFPAGTKSFVVSMYDPEAPTKNGFTHWTVVDLPATTSSLVENAGALDSKTLPAGAIQLDADSGMPRYIGAAPPAGSGVHDYFITITALDVAKAGVTATTSAALTDFTIDSHTIARAVMVFPTHSK